MDRAFFWKIKGSSRLNQIKIFVIRPTNIRLYALEFFAVIAFISKHGTVSIFNNCLFLSLAFSHVSARMHRNCQSCSSIDRRAPWTRPYFGWSTSQSTETCFNHRPLISIGGNGIYWTFTPLYLPWLLRHFVSCYLFYENWKISCLGHLFVQKRTAQRLSRRRTSEETCDTKYYISVSFHLIFLSFSAFAIFPKRISYYY